MKTFHLTLLVRGLTIVDFYMAANFADAMAMVAVDLWKVGISFNEPGMSVTLREV